MKVSNFVLILYLYLVAVVSINGVEIKAAGDEEANKFLNETMLDYGKWLKDNGLDPSPQTNDSVALQIRSFGKVHLNCEVSKQFLVGHSDITNYVAVTETSFERQYIGAGREVDQLYEFKGSFNCSGKISSSEYEDLDQDIPFSGHGDFIVKMRKSDEFAVLMNIGVKQDYKLDFSHSWVDYGFYPEEIEHLKLDGNWDEAQISAKYIEDVQVVFQNLYYNFLLNDAKYMYNPSSHLITRYLRESLEAVDLKDIISEENLPPIVVPVPTTTTMRTTTTTAPTTSPTRPSTTPTSPSSTTPDTSSGKKLLFKSWLFFLNAIIFIYFKI